MRSNRLAWGKKGGHMKKIAELFHVRSGFLKSTNFTVNVRGPSTIMRAQRSNLRPLYTLGNSRAPPKAQIVPGCRRVKLEGRVVHTLGDR